MKKKVGDYRPRNGAQYERVMKPTVTMKFVSCLFFFCLMLKIDARDRVHFFGKKKKSKNKMKKIGEQSTAFVRGHWILIRKLRAQNPSDLQAKYVRSICRNRFWPLCAKWSEVGAPKFVAAFDWPEFCLCIKIHWCSMVRCAFSRRSTIFAVDGLGSRADQSREESKSDWARKWSNL